MLSVLADIILAMLAIIGGIIGFIALVLLMVAILPVRFGVRVTGDNRLDLARATIRPFAGALGVGIEVLRQNVPGHLSYLVTIGLASFGWYLRLHTIHDPASTGDESTPDEEPLDTSRDDAPPSYESPDDDEPDELDEGELSEIDETSPSPEPDDSLMDDVVEADLPTDDAPEPPPVDEFTSDEREDLLNLPDDDGWEEPDLPEAPSSADSTGEDARKSADSMLSRILSLWEEWYPLVRGTLRQLRGILRLRRLHVRGTFGFGDPALTGELLAWAIALRGAESRAVKVRLSGDFESDGLEGEAHAEWSFSLLRTWRTVLYVGWKLFWKWRESRKAEEEDMSSIP
jgi:hypothetical protein